MGYGGAVGGGWGIYCAVRGVVGERGKRDSNFWSWEWDCARFRAGVGVKSYLVMDAPLCLMEAMRPFSNR